MFGLAAVGGAWRFLSVRVRSRLQPRPSMQIGPVWIVWSLALNTPHVAPPSIVCAMYTFHWLLGSSCGLGCAPLPPLAPKNTRSAMPAALAAAHGMIAVFTPAGF